MKTGQPLSSDEMKLLEKYNPQAYQTAKQIKAEREQYKKELENCRSKEDVQKVKQKKLSQFSSEVQTIVRSDMSKEDKAAAMEVVQTRMTNVEKEHIKFVASDKYQRLPEKRDKKDKEVRAQSDKELKELQEAMEESLRENGGEVMTVDAAGSEPTATPSSEETTEAAGGNQAAVSTPERAEPAPAAATSERQRFSARA